MPKNSKMPRYTILLNGTAQAELKTWLLQNGYQTSKLSHDFSDGTSVACIIQKYFPKLIDLHNYSRCSGFSLRMDNWRTLNAKCLGKLGCHQSKSQLKALANGNTQVIEGLLYALMVAVSTVSANRNANKQDNLATNKTMKRKIGSRGISTPKKYVEFSDYEKKLRELEEKQKAMDAVDAKLDELVDAVRQRTEYCNQLIYKFGVPPGMDQEEFRGASPASKWLDEHLMPWKN